MGLNLGIMTAVCREKTQNLLSFLLLALVHVGAIVIVVKIFGSNEYCFEYLTGQANKEDQRNEDLRTNAKHVLNHRRIFHFLSKAASLEPLQPVDKTCFLKTT